MSRFGAKPTGFRSGFKFQLTVMRGQADTYFTLVASPLFSLIFLSVMDFNGRGDLRGHAVIAPALVALRTAALMFSGEMIAEDRENGRLESLVATPSQFGLLVFGRLCACMLLVVPSFASSYLVAGLAFGYWMTLPHPWIFLFALLLTALATAATAAGLSGLFVVAPGARIVQNSLSFPVYLLGGVLIPSSFLPGGLEIVSRLIYLSWGADLLRAATRPEAVPHLALSLGMVVLLGGVSFGFGMVSIVRFLRRASALGILARE